MREGTAAAVALQQLQKTRKQALEPFYETSAHRVAPRTQVLFSAQLFQPKRFFYIALQGGEQLVGGSSAYVSASAERITTMWA
jgi:hypothetical protein